MTTENIFSAVLTLSLLAGGAVAFGSDAATKHAGPAKAETTAVTLPTVTVVGRRAALVRPQPSVDAAFGKQTRVVAHFDDAAMLHHDQAVHRSDRRQPVRDRDHGLAFHQSVQTRLDRGLDLAVERARRLVEQQDRRILEHDASDRDALPLAAAELDAALADVGVVGLAALGVDEAGDDVVR